MKVGEICIFQIPLIQYDGIFSVRCECYYGYEGKAYGSTYYCGKKEILHTGNGKMIDTVDKARKSIIETIKFREKLAERFDEVYDDD